MKIGCHLSVAKGFKHMGEEVLKIGGNTFQFFTRNPRGGKAKAPDLEDLQQFKELAKANQFATILAHAPYTLNACSASEATRQFAWTMFADDLQRMEQIPDSFYNFHPGSHVGQGIEAGIKLISEMLNQNLTVELKTMVLLETMAGKGSEVGSRFEELREIMDRVQCSDKLGVCLDTCHVYDAGYDIVNDLDGVLEKFDRIIGLDKLKAIHLNDSKNPFASHKDRHEKIGQGSIGEKTIFALINHPQCRHLPFFLETPNELSGYQAEILLLKNAYREV